MTIASQGRSLITNSQWKGQNGMAKHRDWIRLYMIEAIQTRQFKEQHNQRGKTTVHGWCPVCAVAKGLKRAQTKEHLHGGECHLTEKVVQQRGKEIDERLLAKMCLVEEVVALKTYGKKKPKRSGSRAEILNNISLHQHQ